MVGLGLGGLEAGRSRGIAWVAWTSLLRSRVGVCSAAVGHRLCATSISGGGPAVLLAELEERGKVGRAVDDVVVATFTSGEAFTLCSDPIAQLRVLIA
jgi:hypothetical protein